MKQHYWLLIFLLLVFSVPVSAITMNVVLPTEYNATIAKQAIFYFRTEYNYTSQYITFTLSGDNNTFFQGCNKNYTSSFLVGKYQYHMLLVKLQFMTPGRHDITYTASNSQQNITVTIITNNEGYNHQSIACPIAIGERKERYGMYENTIVKQRLQNTTRKYPVPF